MPGISNGIDGLSSTLDLDLDVVHRVLDDPLAEALAGRFGWHSRPPGASSSRSIAAFAGGLAHRLAAAVLLEPDRFLDKVAGDLLDVAADIADLGELGRLDLHERRVGKLRRGAG